VSSFDGDDDDDGDDNDDVVAGTSILVSLASTTWVSRHERAGECGWRANECHAFIPMQGGDGDA
jgi:hypothetical protein